MRSTLMLSLALLLPSAVFAQTAGDWPQFRGPTGMGVSPAKGLPLTWSPTENIVWKTPLPGAGSSSPIVVGDKIFVTCYSGFAVPGMEGGNMSQLKLHLVCLDRAKGTIVWDKTVEPKLPEQDRIRDGHGYASSTPASDGERIYTFFGKSGVHAFDLKGNHLWDADVGSKVDGFGTGASPIVSGNLLIVNASVESQQLFGLDKKTGTVVWKAKGIVQAWNTPVFVPVKGGKTELVIGMQGKVLGFDPVKGEQLWSCNNEIGWYIVPSPVAKDGMVWSLGGRSGIIAAAVKAGGRGDVTKSHRMWTSNKGCNVMSPILHEGHLYWFSDAGLACCADAATGKTLYEERMRSETVWASPILADGKIYYLDRTGRTNVVKAAPKFEILATNELGERSTFNASPAVAGDRLYIRSDKTLYCIGKK